MNRWRNGMIGAWWLAMVISISCYFLPWSFVIRGFRFPWHGQPALAAAIIALIIGTVAAARGWTGRGDRALWSIASGLIAVELAFKLAFWLGPDVATAKGTISGPDMEAPIAFDIPVPPLPGFYASLAFAVVSLALAIGLAATRARLPIVADKVSA